MYRIVESLLEKWQAATFQDYAQLLLAIVVVGWFMCRYQK